jgi:hypothetical protein
MPMSWRKISEADLPACLDVQPASLGDEIVGRQTAMEIWRRLLRDPVFVAAAFESDPPIRGHRIVGFGASAFVSAPFMDAEIAHPRPGINSRIIASVHAGQSVLLTPDQIARANAGMGADSVILSGSWRDEIMTLAERTEVQTLLAMSYTELYSGYRLRRMLWESSCEPEHRFARLSGVYRAIGEFPEIGRVLNLITPETAASVPASIGNVVFRYSDPLLRLRESDQQLLLAALKGATDVELAVHLDLNVAAVKARWRSIFARIVEVKPDLVKDRESPEGRGLQKRHHVLAYVRAHPEDLRPYAWKQAPLERTSSRPHRPGPPA